MKVPGNRPAKFRRMAAVALMLAAGVFFTQDAAYAQASDERAPWTAVGSDGAVDETSETLFEFINNDLRHRAGRLLGVKARYNIVAAGGLRRINNNNPAQVVIRYRDQDDAGTTARVLVQIHRKNIFTGDTGMIYQFDSNAPAAFVTTVGDAQVLLDCDATGNEGALDFDFESNIYWVDTTVSRTTTAVQPAFAGIQITNNPNCLEGPPTTAASVGAASARKKK